MCTIGFLKFFLGGGVVKWIGMGDNVPLSQDFLSWRIGFPT